MFARPEHQCPGLLDLLATFDVEDYARRADRVGRRLLANDADLVAQIGSLLRSCAVCSIPDPLEQATGDVARLFLEAQHFILTERQPRYEPYVGVPLLRHVLGVDTDAQLMHTRDRIWFAFHEILSGAVAYETSALSAPARWHKQQFDPSVACARVATLAAISRVAPAADARRRFGRPKLRGDAMSLRDIAADPTGARAVRYLLVFPQTTFHDEVAFQRLILLTECLFWGTLVFVRSARTAIEAGRLSNALELLRHATEFAAPLIKVFHAVRVMPPEHFGAFREATGQASAVQSQSWQLLDANVYGVLQTKVAALQRHPEVTHVLQLTGPQFVPLVRMIERADCDDLYLQVRSLDNALRAWRGFHERQLAGRHDPSYLPQGAMGTGGTAGLPYLGAQRPPRAKRCTGSADDPSRT